MRHLCVALAILALLSSGRHAAEDILIEAESFQNPGGWVNDNQSMMQIGSPYLLAHGLGVPVDDATTTIQVSKPGRYHMWVRTRDWTRRWGSEDSPGRFLVRINGLSAGVEFGTENADWHWQDGGIIKLRKGDNEISLHDLTGFDGRCDAILFAADRKAIPSGKVCDFKAHDASDGGSYDLVVVGGGIAGCCAAVSAARLGCKVALVQNRPILGGNNSSEVRVGLSGRIFQEPYPRVGALMDELGGIGHWNNVEAKEDPDSERSKHIKSVLKAHPEKLTHNAGPASNYEDDKKLSLIKAEPNITLFLNTHVISVVKDGDKIASVTGRNISTGADIIISGTMFADCTGDANLGYLAGADFRMGRESKAETGERDAPENADDMTMGMSVQWYSTDTDSASPFPDCPWALEFNEDTFIDTERGDWNWEAGLNNDQINDSEFVRDHALRAVYGNWAYLKNHSSVKDKYAGKKLEWVAYIGGKRESRRLLGDYILKEEDLLNTVRYEDASFTTTWTIDLHYPKYIPGLDGDPFLAISVAPKIRPCTVPYRCLYSRNVSNLFMAGRDISATHIALGSIRVMRTGGMMGEVVGMAASICREKGVSPRGVYQNYLPELRALMTKGVARTPYGNTALDLHSMMRPAPRSAVMSDDDYFVWGGSLTKDDDGTYHLLYSRWKKEYGFQSWVTRSEIAHATAPSPFGPFTHQDVALAPRGEQYWDGMCTHNPTIKRFGDKYYLYYMGNRGDGKVIKDALNWTHRNNQRIGVAVADSPWGPWERSDTPLIDVGQNEDDADALMVSNPSVTQCPDGSYLCVYKAVGKHRPMPFGGPVVHLSARSDSPTGPFVKQYKTLFDAQGSDFPAEDPFVWCQDGRYYAVVKDQGGHFQGNKLRSLVLFDSDNGLDWKTAEHTFITDTHLLWEDGNLDTVRNLERPQIYIENGKPVSLSVAISNEALTSTYNVQIPLADF